MSEVEQVPEQEKDLITAVSELLEGVPGAPDKDKLLEWKKTFGGNLHVFRMGDDDFYIFRPLGRKEYRTVQSLPEVLKKADATATLADIQEKYTDEICLMAILYPSKEELITRLEFLGGLSQMLSEQIAYASCLVSPDTAVANIRKL